MKSVRILHTADCHLGSGRSFVQSGKSELCTTFLHITELCRKNAIDFLLIAGDLFDSPFADRETVRKVTDAIAGIPDTDVIIASGNHDCACADSVYDTFTFPENVHLFTSGISYIDLPEKNTRIYGAGFITPHCTSSMLSGFSAKATDMINIGVLHGELSGSADSGLYNTLSDSMIAASGLDYLALGHIHKRSEILKSGNTFYSYCGCPDGRGFDETGSKGVYIGTVFKGGCDLCYHELSSRLYISDSVDISGCTSSQHAAKAVLEYLKKAHADNFAENLYKLTLTGSINPDIILNTTQIQSELSRSVQYCEISDCTEPELADLEVLASEQTLRGAFARKMLNRIDEAAPDQQMILRLALRTGLRAFEREVKLLDN